MVKKKPPAILEPDADDFCSLIARGIIRLLGSSANPANLTETNPNREPESDPSDTSIIQ